MNRKIIKQILIVVVISAIPGLLSYMASSSLIFDKLIAYGYVGEAINIPVIQDYCLWISIVLSALFLSLNLIVTKVKYDHILEQRNLLIKMNKKVLSSALGKRFLSEASAFDIRIFVPKHPIIYKIIIGRHHPENVRQNTNIFYFFEFSLFQTFYHDSLGGCVPLVCTIH